jgi:2'-5' RNA ligase
LELPASVRETLASLDPRLPKLRWLKAEQLHLTMSFLGQVTPSEEERLREVLGTVEVPAFFLPIACAGSFGGARPSVVWAGVGKGHPHLFALHKFVQDALLAAGLNADLRSFHPHITIGRANGISHAALQPFLREHAEREFGLCHITSFVVFSSVLSPEGSEYSVEFRREFST